MDDNLILLVDEGMRSDLPLEMLEALRPVLVNSAEELAAALADGFEGWSEYRDHILGHSSSKSKE